MTARIIDGKQVAADIRAELKEEVARLKTRGIVPGLGVILVGDDPASQSYVTGKERACEEIGIYSDDNRLPAEHVAGGADRSGRADEPRSEDPRHPGPTAAAKAPR